MASASADAELRFDDVALVTEAGATIVHDVDLALPLTGVTVLVGPSGSGKSTLLRLCNRLEVPTAGRITYRGTDLADLDPLVLRRRVALVFQRPTMFPGTVRDNCHVAAPDADDQRCADVLARCGLPSSVLDRTADDLSGGEAQRACVARSLLTEPEVVLADEITSSLDAGNRHRLEHLARQLADDGTPVVWVTHDLEQARRLADVTVVVVDGTVADADAARDFWASSTRHAGEPGRRAHGGPGSRRGCTSAGATDGEHDHGPTSPEPG